jgi:hypothetical protein
MFDGFFFGKHVENDEELLAVVHKHWFIGLRFLFWPTCAFLLCWIFLYVVPFRPVFYAVALLSVVSLVWWLRNFFDYYLDAWIVTDQGVIDLEWHGWFHRQSTRILYSDIQGVSYEIQGLCGTLLRYGTVSIEKISTGSVISMTHVPHPRNVEGLILRNMEAYLHTKNLRNVRHVQELFADFVATRTHLHDLDAPQE